MKKKLYRSRRDQKLCGVCAGIAEYFSIDPTIVRLLFVLFALTASGILAYIICALLIPEETDTDNNNIIDA